MGSRKKDIDLASIVPVRNLLQGQVARHRMSLAKALEELALRTALLTQGKTQEALDTFVWERIFAQDISLCGYNLSGLVISRCHFRRVDFRGAIMAGVEVRSGSLTIFTDCHGVEQFAASGAALIVDTEKVRAEMATIWTETQAVVDMFTARRLLARD